MRRRVVASPLIATVCVLLLGVPTADSGQERSLSRRKRYIVFPEGSSFSIALCMSVHTLTPDDIFTEGMNWGISYDLPNESKPELEPFLELRSDKFKENRYGHKGVGSITNDRWQGSELEPWKYSEGLYPIPPPRRKFYKSDYRYIQRRHRRELYNKLEVVMNAMGFDGRTCILRALCEASQRLMPKGNTLVEEMMRIAFSLPLQRVLSFEPPEHHTYTNAHKAGHEGVNCIAAFPGCSFSLIDMVLGNYNAPEYPMPPPEDVTGKPDEGDAAGDARYSMK